jgi:hypothetical protein
MKVTKGQILVITQGEAAGFSILCNMRALEEFDTVSQIKAFKKLISFDNDTLCEQQEMFLAWLMNKHLIQPTPKRKGQQWWLGQNGELFQPFD